MGVLPTMRSDKSEILPYNFKDYYAFIGLEKLSDHPSFRMFNHWHDAVEIIVPIRGHMVYSINGELVHLDENNGVFINSNQIHYGFSADNTDCEFVFALWHPLILCATNSIEKNYVKPITDNAAIPYIRLNREIDWEKTIMDDACELNAQLYAPSAPLALQSLIFKMWKTIFDNTAHEEDDSSHVSPQLSILKDMLSYVHEHYPEKISLNDIANAGKINGSRKQLDKGRQVYAFGAGTQKMYDYLNDNPECMSAPVDYTNDIRSISALDNFISINNAVDIDLFGQVNAESAGVKHISGAGGQLDFVLGAYLSKGGKSFICLSSTFFNKKTGQLESRIRPTLENGSIITDTRANVHYLCTEYGCVDLKGLTSWEKAEALISVAHPDFREELIREAEKLHIWRRSNKI